MHVVRKQHHAMMKCSLPRICIVALLFASGVSNALPKTRNDFANEVFSNVKLIESENDVVGWRIQIVHAPTRTYVMAQSFEGVPQAPCLTEAEFANGNLRFEFPKGCQVQGVFSGVVRGNVLVGGFSYGMVGPDGEARITLKRLSR